MPNVRLAFRQLVKSPGFALTVILTMALGIGANTAIFTLVHAVLLKSLPVVDPKTLCSYHQDRTADVQRSILCDSDTYKKHTKH